MALREASSILPDSPCTGVCRIGADGYCEGCLRTLSEIARWGTMPRAERRAVYEALAVRRESGTENGSGGASAGTSGPQAREKR